MFIDMQYQNLPYLIQSILCRKVFLHSYIINPIMLPKDCGFPNGGFPRKMYAYSYVPTKYRVLDTKRLYRYKNHYYCNVTCVKKKFVCFYLSKTIRFLLWSLYCSIFAHCDLLYIYIIIGRDHYYILLFAS